MLAAGVTTGGICTIRYYEGLGRKYSIYFVCFAAGILIAVSFLHIVPKSLEMNAAASAYLLIGFVVLHLFNRFITAFVCEKDADAPAGIGWMAVIGIGFHSFVDGLVYTVTFSVSIFTGVLAAAGMVLHEFPEGIITYMLLIRGGFSRNKATLLAFAAAALSTPMGTLTSYPVIHQLDRPILGALLALSAGSLVYVGATHLLPQAEKEQGIFSLLSLAAGILIAVIIVLCV